MPDRPDFRRFTIAQTVPDYHTWTFDCISSLMGQPAAGNVGYAEWRSVTPDGHVIPVDDAGGWMLILTGCGADDHPFLSLTMDLHRFHRVSAADSWRLYAVAGWAAASNIDNNLFGGRAVIRCDT